MRILIFAIIVLVTLMCLPAQLSAQGKAEHDLGEYYRDWAMVTEGASITSPSKVMNGNDLEGIIGGKAPVRGRDSGGCVFADVVQREEFTIDLGQTRMLGTIMYDCELVRRTPSKFKIDVSNVSARGPWTTVYNPDTVNAQALLGINDVPARWIHVDLGDNADRRGSRIHRFRVRPRYQLPSGEKLVQDFHKNLRRDQPGLATFWQAVDSKSWSAACDELIRFYSTRAEPVKNVADYKKNERVEMWYADRVVDGEHDFQFSSSDWDWMAAKPGAAIPALGLLPGAYSIFHLFTTSYIESGDPKYAQKASELLTDWLQDFPYPGWDSDYEGNLIDAWAGLKASGRTNALNYMLKGFVTEKKAFSRDLKMNLIVSVWQHLEILHAIRPHVGGNWLTNVNSGLFNVAADHPEYVLQKQWLQDSLASFENSLTMDVFPCGREVEDSTMYVPIASGQMTGQYTKIREVGIKLKPELEERMSRLYDAMAWMHYPDNSCPTIGDCGRLSPLPGGETCVPDKYMALYDRPDFKYLNSRGKEGTSPAEVSRTFAGWYIMRSPWEVTPYEDARQMFFKCSQEGAHGNRAHGHLDQLEVTVYAYGRELLTDPGMTGYGLPSNATMRSTPAHNTLCVNGEDQEEKAGNERAWAAGKGADFVDADFQTCSTAFHRRQIVFLKSGAGLPDYWLVHDIVSGRKVEHTIQSSYHFVEGANPVLKGKSAHSTFSEGGNLLVYSAGSSPEPILIDYTIADNKRGEAPAKCALISVKQMIPAALTTFLVPYQGKDVPQFAAEEMKADNGEGSAYAVPSKFGKDIVILADTGGTRRSFAGGKVVSDAQAVVLRFDTKGKLIYGFQFGGTETIYGGQKAIRVESGKTFAEVGK